MRPKRSCLASMIHPILQSDAEPDKPEPFLLNKWQTKPVRYAAALTVGKRRPRLNWRFVSTKESFSRADSESMSHAPAILAWLSAPRRLFVEQSPQITAPLGRIFGKATLWQLGDRRLSRGPSQRLSRHFKRGASTRIVSEPSSIGKSSTARMVSCRLER